MKIFLIGFMGSGKTTLGKKLAARLNYPFIDLDQVLEDKVGITINDYFATHGEESFRQLESEVLKSGEFPADAVISTGGGLPCFFDHMQWMNNHGQTVYIKLSPKGLASRLENNKDDRPLLRHKHGDELIKFIEEKLADREQYYSQARIIAEGLSLTAEQVEGMLKESGGL